tara:strand:- start:595 stop:984 length:390 start_codon:yes stop_codon:yes gene_type:complete
MKKDIIVFDGVCILCNKFYMWVLKNDRLNNFKFTNIQSDFYLKNKKINKSIDSILVITKNEEILYESNAVNYILKKINKLLLIRFLILITPNFISNFFYGIIAKNRYKIFGKKDSCYVPTEEEIKKFII